MHLLRPDNASLVLDINSHRAAVVSRLPDDNVEEERRVLQDGSRRAHAIDLDVARQGLGADANREDRQLFRLERQQCLVQRHVPGISAVRNEDNPRNGKAFELVAHTVESCAKLGLRTTEGQRIAGRDTSGGR